MSRLAILVLALSTTGCVVITGSGELETETYRIGETHREISVCCGFELHLEQGAPALRVRADDNILDDIEVQDSGDRIVVDYDRPAASYYPSEPVQVYARLVDPNVIEASGGSDIEAEPIDTDRLEVLMSGGSRADFHELTTPELELTASGGSEARMSGEVGTQEVDLSGGSVYEALLLKSRTTELNVSGGSAAEVDVERTLNVDASGGSTVRYTGDPKVTRDISGGSTVRSIE